MRRVLVSALAALAVLVPTGTAWARGDGWQPADAEPFDLTACGGQPFHVDFPVNKEFFRIVTLGHQEVVQVTGNFIVEFTNTDTGQSITIKAQGPGFSPTALPEFSARGNNVVTLDPNQAASSGLPEMFVNSGYISITFNDDDTLTVNKLTGSLTDLCSFIG